MLVSEVWLDVEVCVPAVSVQCAGSDGSGHDRIQPVVQPFAQSDLAVLGQVYALVGDDLLAELCGQLFLRGCVDVAEDAVAVFLMADHDAALPTAIVLFAHHAVAGRPAFTHLNRLLCRNSSLFTPSQFLTVLLAAFSL